MGSASTLEPRDTAWLADIPVTRAAARLAPLAAWRPTPDLGVTVRGAVGKALFDVVCVRPDRDCGPCVHRASCLIPGWFDPNRLGGAAPRPFSLAVDADADVLVAAYTFTGPLPRHTAFVDALLRAAAAGLGPDDRRVPFELQRLHVQGDGAATVVVADGRVVGSWAEPAPLARFVALPRRRVRGARIHLGRVDLGRGVSPSFDAIVRACARRVRLLFRTLAGRDLDRWWDAADVPFEWEGDRERASRWSHRVGDRVDISGYSGTLSVGPEAGRFADLLAAAVVLGAGKNTTTGGGRVAVDWVTE